MAIGSSSVPQQTPSSAILAVVEPVIVTCPPHCAVVAVTSVGHVGGHLDFHIVFIILRVFATRESRCQHEGKHADFRCSVHGSFIL